MPDDPHKTPPSISRRTASRIADREHQFSLVARAALIGTGAALIIVALALGIDDTSPSEEVKKEVVPVGTATEKTEIVRTVPKAAPSVVPSENTTTRKTISKETTTTTKSHQFESTETLLAIGGLGAVLMLAGVLRLKSFEFGGAKVEFSEAAWAVEVYKAAEDRASKAPPQLVETTSAADLADVLTKAVLTEAAMRDAEPEELPAIAEEIFKKAGL